MTKPDRVLDLLAKLSSSNRMELIETIDSLGWLSDVRAVEYLLPFSRHIRWEIQGAVADALGRIGDIQALNVLMTMYLGETYSLIESDGAPHRFGAIVGGVAISRIYSCLMASRMRR